MENMIRVFTLSCCCFFLYFKFIHYQGSVYQRIVFPALLSTAIACCVYFFKISSSATYLTFVFFVMSIYLCILEKKSLGQIIVAVLISIAAEYGFLIFSAILSAAIFTLLPFSSNAVQSVGPLLFSVVINAFFIILPFKIPRFKNGFSFLQQQESSGIGLIISGLLIIIATLLFQYDLDDLMLTLLIGGAAICIAGVTIWWRVELTKLYRLRQNEKTIDEFQTLLSEKDAQLQKLAAGNEFQGKIIHRDNKLIPAMYNTVAAFLAGAAESLPTEQKTEGARLLQQLSELAQERTGILIQHQKAHKVLPETGIGLIDDILSYFLQRASDNEIRFDVRLSCDVRAAIEPIITVSKLETLIADLVENAIIATSHSRHRQILISFEISSGAFMLTVQDSGASFDAETLLTLGLKQVTTHGHEGGSGVGYMTVFEILQETQASLIIEELVPSLSGFSKAVRIRFDGRYGYQIRSPRAGVLAPSISREGLVVVATGGEA